MLTLPADFIAPDYDGGSIANVPATVAHWLNIPFQGLPPLRPELRGDFTGIKRVVQILIDGLGWNLLPGLQEKHPVFFAHSAVSGKITSIFPSTTSAALSTLWTGLGPAQHGLVGLRMFFPEYGALGQLINLSPNMGGEPEMLEAEGMEAETFLSGQGLGQQLAFAGVPGYAFKSWAFIESPLSRMHGRGLAKQFGILTAADMFVQIRELLAANVEDHLFIGAYWPAVDSLSHRYGPFAPHVAAEAEATIVQLQTLLLEPLQQEGRNDTLIYVLADHGQVVTPVPEKLVIPEQHQVLREGLLMIPAGDSRCVYLYTRHGWQKKVLDYLNSELAHALVAWPAGEALAQGLLGPPPHAPQTERRVGDIVVAMRDGYAMVNEGAAEGVKKMAGRHGSLTPDEMEVPFLVYFV